jgi:hypothetical protein
MVVTGNSPISSRHALPAVLLAALLGLAAAGAAGSARLLRVRARRS